MSDQVCVENPTPQMSAIELLLEPLVKKMVTEMMTNCFEVYKAVHRNDRLMVKEVLAEIMEERNTTAKQAAHRSQQIMGQSLNDYANAFGAQQPPNYPPTVTKVASLGDKLQDTLKELYNR